MHWHLSGPGCVCGGGGGGRGGQGVVENPPLTDKSFFTFQRHSADANANRRTDVCSLLLQRSILACNNTRKHANTDHKAHPGKRSNLNKHVRVYTGLLIQYLDLKKFRSTLRMYITMIFPLFSKGG